MKRSDPEYWDNVTEVEEADVPMDDGLIPLDLTVFDPQTAQKQVDWFVMPKFSIFVFQEFELR